MEWVGREMESSYGRLLFPLPKELRCIFMSLLLYWASILAQYPFTTTKTRALWRPTNIIHTTTL